MMATPAIMGLSLGLAIGLLDFIVLEWMARSMVTRAAEQGASDEERKKVTLFMRTMAYLSLILFPIIGYFVGPYAFASGQ